jgi:uncharacterized membrane protein
MPWKIIFSIIYITYIGYSTWRSLIFISNSHGAPLEFILYAASSITITLFIAARSIHTGRIKNARGIFDVITTFFLNLIAQFAIFYAFNSGLF